MAKSLRGKSHYRKSSSKSGSSSRSKLRRGRLIKRVSKYKSKFKKLGGGKSKKNQKNSILYFGRKVHTDIKDCQIIHGIYCMEN